MTLGTDRFTPATTTRSERQVNVAGHRAEPAAHHVSPAASAPRLVGWDDPQPRPRRPDRLPGHVHGGAPVLDQCPGVPSRRSSAGTEAIGKGLVSWDRLDPGGERK